MENEEIWKSVVGYEGLYEVSNLGRVKSLPRVVYENGYVHRTTKEKILKSPSGSAGYPNIGLCSEGLNRTTPVHLLVAVAFLGHTPDGHKLVVDHINGIKADNRVENIRIVTNRFNLSVGKRKSDNRVTSKYPGVCWHKCSKKWAAVLRLDGIPRNLGVFTNEIDAAHAYQDELLKIQSQGRM